MLVTTAPQPRQVALSCASTSVVKEESFLSRSMLNVGLSQLPPAEPGEHMRAEVIVVHPENCGETAWPLPTIWVIFGLGPKNPRPDKTPRSLDHRAVGFAQCGLAIVNHHRPRGMISGFPGTTTR